MIRYSAQIAFAAVLSSAAFGQTFEVADVHAKVPGFAQGMTGGELRGGRYDIRSATMVDLIRTAYGLGDANQVVGGSDWLDSDRFDIAAKAPPSTSPETLRLMLQALLADRFRLVVHQTSKPIHVFALSMGKGKPKLKGSDGEGSSGCPFPDPPHPHWLHSCHNLTMEQFAGQLRKMAGAGGYVTASVVDQTDLKGAWDFEIKWTDRGLRAEAGADSITLFDAIDKQLGLKLESQIVAMPVIVVDSANRKPTANAPGVTTRLEPSHKAEFEVASVKQSMPGERQRVTVRNDRVDVRANSLKQLFIYAWNMNPDAMILNTPKFWYEPQFDIVAKAPISPVDVDDVRLMMRALLVDRFKLTFHTENRIVDAYILTAVKPKLAKADPSNRSVCRGGPGPDGKDPRDANPVNATLITCLNTTMAQFAERLGQSGFHVPNTVLDATGLSGAYDFTLNYAWKNVLQNRPPSADPDGAISLVEAVNKQLGLKLELQKRSVPVLVIDHIEEKPTEN